MRVLLDECLPGRLAGELSGHIVTTVPKAGWASIKNGQLLKLIEGKFDLIEGKFDAFITIDGSLIAQNTATNLSFGIIVLRARSNRISDLKPLAPAILTHCPICGPARSTFCAEGTAVLPVGSR